AYDSIEAKQRLGEIALKAAFEDFRSAAHGEIMDDPRLRERQSGHVASKPQQLGDGAGRATDVRRRAQDPFLQQPNDRLQLRDVAIVSLAVGLHVPGNLLARQATAAGK